MLNVGKYFQPFERIELIEPFEQPLNQPRDLNLCLVSRKARKGIKQQTTNYKQQTQPT